MLKYEITHFVFLLISWWRCVWTMASQYSSRFGRKSSKTSSWIVRRKRTAGTFS